MLQRVMRRGAGWWLISLGLVLRAMGGLTVPCWTISEIPTQKRLHGKMRASVV